MLKIGLTGNIASGKSALQKYLEEKNLPVIDADKICHLLMTNNVHIITRIKNCFKEYDVIDENNNLSKKKLANLIYSDENLRKQLEEIMHPAVRKEIEEFFDKKSDYPIVFAAVPLLFEAKMEKMFDKIVLVSTNENIRLARLQNRNNLSETMAKKMIASQMCEKEKLSGCDFVITNNSDLPALFVQADNLLQILTKQ